MLIDTIHHYHRLFIIIIVIFVPQCVNPWQVVHTAKTFFGYKPSGSVWTGDAVATVRVLAAQQASARVDGAPRQRYDIILHDAFSGGGVPQALYTRVFVKELAGLLEDDGCVCKNLKI